MQVKRTIFFAEIAKKVAKKFGGLGKSVYLCTRFRGYDLCKHQDSDLWKISIDREVVQEASAFQFFNFLILEFWSTWVWRQTVNTKCIMKDSRSGTETMIILQGF